MIFSPEKITIFLCICNGVVCSIFIFGLLHVHDLIILFVAYKVVVAIITTNASIAAGAVHASRTLFLGSTAHLAIQVHVVITTQTTITEGPIVAPLHAISVWANASVLVPPPSICN